MEKNINPKLRKYKEKYNKLFKEYRLEIMNENGFNYDSINEIFIKKIHSNTDLIIRNDRISIIENSLNKYGKTIIIKSNNELFQIPEGLNEIKLSSIEFSKKYRIFSVQGTYANIYLTPSIQKKYLQIYDSLDNFESIILENFNIEINFTNCDNTYKHLIERDILGNKDAFGVYSISYFDKYFEESLKDINETIKNNIEQSLIIEGIYNNLNKKE